MTVTLHVDLFGCVLSCAGGFDLVLLFSYMTYNFMYLSFSILRSSSVLKIDTITFAKLNTPLSKKPPIYIKAPPTPLKRILFTDPLFSLQSPLSARDKIKTA